jgi:NAD(P)-dependent dehydrogenase (short-subunit alcohol dehydrogenase family)
MTTSVVLITGALTGIGRATALMADNWLADSVRSVNRLAIEQVPLS